MTMRIPKIEIGIHSELNLCLSARLRGKDSDGAGPCGEAGEEWRYRIRAGKSKGLTVYRS